MGGAGYGEGGQMHALDAQTPYLRQIMGFIGISDVHFIALEGTTNDGLREASLARAREEIRQAVARLGN